MSSVETKNKKKSGADDAAGVPGAFASLVSPGKAIKKTKKLGTQKFYVSKELREDVGLGLEKYKGLGATLEKVKKDREKAGEDAGVPSMFGGTTLKSPPTLTRPAAGKPTRGMSVPVRGKMAPSRGKSTRERPKFDILSLVDGAIEEGATEEAKEKAAAEKALASAPILPKKRVKKVKQLDSAGNEEEVEVEVDEEDAEGQEEETENKAEEEKEEEPPKDEEKEKEKTDEVVPSSRSAKLLSKVDQVIESDSASGVPSLFGSAVTSNGATPAWKARLQTPKTTTQKKKVTLLEKTQSKSFKSPSARPKPKKSKSTPNVVSGVASPPTSPGISGVEKSVSSPKKKAKSAPDVISDKSPGKKTKSKLSPATTPEASPAPAVSESKPEPGPATPAKIPKLDETEESTTAAPTETPKPDVIEEPEPASPSEMPKVDTAPDMSPESSKPDVTEESEPTPPPSETPKPDKAIEPESTAPAETPKPDVTETEPAASVEAPKTPPAATPKPVVTKTPPATSPRPVSTETPPSTSPKPALPQTSPAVKISRPDNESAPPASVVPTKQESMESNTAQPVQGGPALESKETDISTKEEGTKRASTSKYYDSDSDGSSDDDSSDDEKLQSTRKPKSAISQVVPKSSPKKNQNAKIADEKPAFDLDTQESPTSTIAGVSGHMPAPTVQTHFNQTSLAPTGDLTLDRLRKDIEDIKKKLDNTSVNVKLELADLKKQFNMEKETLRVTYMRDIQSKRKVTEKLDKEHQKLVEQEQKQIEELRAANTRLRATLERLPKQMVEVTASNESLSRANEDIAGHFAQLMKFSKKLQADHARLEESSNKCKEEYLPRYRQELWERQQFLNAETRIKNLYRNCAIKIAKRVDQTKQADLIEDISTMVLETEGEMNPEGFDPTVLSSSHHVARRNYMSDSDSDSDSSSDSDSDSD